MRIDFELSGGGTVYLLRPLTRAARTWVEEHLPADATWFGGAVVVEHPYIGHHLRACLRRGEECELCGQAGCAESCLALFGPGVPGAWRRAAEQAWLEEDDDGPNGFIICGVGGG